MPLQYISDYNRDQLVSFQAILDIMEKLSREEMEELKIMIRPYLVFRQRLDDYHARYFSGYCRKACFDTGLSACCGFESIITFFADQVITVLSSRPEDLEVLIEKLSWPNDTGKCVYTGPKGCVWKLRPVSCAMFFCHEAKVSVFKSYPEAESLWGMFLEQERDFTWPTKLVVFDQIEKFFLRYGVSSPHLYFHRSPGLLKLKAESGLES